MNDDEAGSDHLARLEVAIQSLLDLISTLTFFIKFQAIVFGEAKRERDAKIMETLDELGKRVQELEARML